MKSRLFLAAAIAFLAAPAAAQPNRDSELHAFLQERFAEDRTDAPDTRYAHGWADLNGDGRPEALVYIMSTTFCGTGGCDLYIYAPRQRSFQQLARMSVTNPPIRVLNSNTGGWRDIAVFVAGGGTRARTVLLRQRGGTYPGNPTTAGVALRRVPPGRVVIGANDRGRRLF